MTNICFQTLKNISKKNLYSTKNRTMKFNIRRLMDYSKRMRVIGDETCASWGTLQYSEQVADKSVRKWERQEDISNKVNVPYYLCGTIFIFQFRFQIINMNKRNELINRKIVSCTNSAFEAWKGEHSNITR